MIAIIDYGVGNLYSLTSSLSYLGIEAKVTACEKELKKADKIILPGVGAFGDAAEKLRATGLVEVIKEEAARGKYLLGICLGMQLLFEKSHEYGEHQGLGLVEGYIGSMGEDTNLKVPHMGWNKLDILKKDSIFQYIADGSYVYYVHSFYAKGCVENTLASSIYDIEIPGVVKSGTVYGMQFHPEKSGEAGLGLLKGFNELR